MNPADMYPHEVPLPQWMRRLREIDFMVAIHEDVDEIASDLRTAAEQICDALNEYLHLSGIGDDTPLPLIAYNFIGFTYLYDHYRRYTLATMPKASLARFTTLHGAEMGPLAEPFTYPLAFEAFGLFLHEHGYPVKFLGSHHSRFDRINRLRIYQ